jgi:hypothetical protein
VGGDTGAEVEGRNVRWNDLLIPYRFADSVGAVHCLRVHVTTLAQDWCGEEILLVFSGFRPDRHNSLVGLGKIWFTKVFVSSGFMPIAGCDQGRNGLEILNIKKPSPAAKSETVVSKFHFP